MLHTTRQLIAQTYLKVFRKKIYLVIAGFGAVMILWISVTLPNIKLFTNLPQVFSLADKVKIFFTSFGTLTTNFRIIDQVFIVIIALLAGINIALMIYQVRARAKAQRASGIGILGTILGLLGIGCSACGSLILASIFGTGVAASITTILPLGGTEFAIIGTLILLAVTHYTMKKIVGTNTY